MTRKLRRRLVLAGAPLALGTLVLARSTGNLRALGAAPQGARLARMQASAQYRGGAFRNTHPEPLMTPGQGWRTFKEFAFGSEQRTPPGPLPLASPVEAWRAPAASGLRVTWLGHSTLLVEMDGARILTDPMWSERASPSTLLGPRRFSSPPVPLSALPPLDAVVISHDHYDHLDMSTIEALRGTDVPFFVPLGVGAHLERWGVGPERITELDWWEEAPLAGTSLVLAATPAQHFSGRHLGDRNRTLWASWVLRGPRHRVFFGGDTGLAPELGDIRTRFGPFDLIALEVGAWHPNWGSIHLGPQNALVAHAQLGGGPLLPIHWGTFELALHAWDEPINVLEAAAKEQNVPLLAPMPGQPIEPGAPPAVHPWWRRVSAR